MFVFLAITYRTRTKLPSNTFPTTNIMNSPTEPSPSLSTNFTFLNSRSPSNHDLKQEALMKVLVEDIEEMQGKILNISNQIQKT